MAAFSDELYGVLTGDEEGRLCRDIPEAACHEQPGNFAAHLVSLSLTKIGDGLADPKVMLTWLLTALGAPAYMAGFLVPVREAGALLPQLFIAGNIRALARRKYVWAAGSFVQGLAVLGMAFAALMLEGAAAGAAVLTALTLFALARSVCSVAYKDVLGKTVTKSARGTVTGTANSLASGFVLLFGLALALGILERSIAVVTAALFLAGVFWVLAGAVFLRLREEAGATEGGRNAWALAIGQLSLLREDPQLRRFIAARALLMASALSPPFLLMLAPDGGGLAALGSFLSASALAGFLSAYVWGRLSDRSSRKVLALAGFAASLALGLALAGDLMGGESGALLLPFWFFVLMIAHQGVRLGRSTHIVDMADEETRASYTALSNTIIGFLLMLGGGFGGLAALTSVETVIGIMAFMALCGGFAALGLKEVQSEA